MLVLDTWYWVKVRENILRHFKYLVYRNKEQKFPKDQGKSLKNMQLEYEIATDRKFWRSIEEVYLRHR